MNKRLRIMFSMLFISILMVLAGCSGEGSDLLGDKEKKVVAEAEKEITADSKNENEEWSAAWVLYEGERFENTGEGTSKADLVVSMTDDQFFDACGIVIDEDCIEMCTDVVDSRCNFMCEGNFGSSTACAEGLNKLIDSSGFKVAMDQGYFSGWLLRSADTLVEVGTPEAEELNPGVDEEFIAVIREANLSDRGRYEAMTTAQLIGTALRDAGYSYDDVDKAYVNYVLFNEHKMLTDFVVHLSGGDIYSLDLSVDESRPDHFRDFDFVATLD